MKATDAIQKSWKTSAKQRTFETRVKLGKRKCTCVQRRSKQLKTEGNNSRFEKEQDSWRSEGAGVLAWGCNCALRCEGMLRGELNRCTVPCITGTHWHRPKSQHTAPVRHDQQGILREKETQQSKARYSRAMRQRDNRNTLEQKNLSLYTVLWDKDKLPFLCPFLLPNDLERTLVDHAWLW